MDDQDECRIRALFCDSNQGLQTASPDLAFLSTPPATRLLMDMSGKSELLSQVMEKLKSGGHRVLVYSQFKRMLDILEEWMNLKVSKQAGRKVDGTG